MMLSMMLYNVTWYHIPASANFLSVDIESCKLQCVFDADKEFRTTHTHTHTLQFFKQATEPDRSLSSLWRTEHLTFFNGTNNKPSRRFVAGYLHVKCCNIRVKRPGLPLSLLDDGTFKDPVKRPDIPNEPERKPRRKARRGTGHG